jgi:hypothetical protein
MPDHPTNPSAATIRARLVDALRRDLIGPCPDDDDIVRERLKNNPSRWYLTGFLAPALDGMSEGTESIEDEGDPLFSEEPSDPETGTGGGRAADDAPDDEPSARKSRVPSSCGLTVLVDASVGEVEVALSWGDYVTIPPLPDEVFSDEKAQYDPAYRNVQWQRVPGQAPLRLPVPENGRGRPVLVPGSAGAQRPGGALFVLAHARPYTLDQPDGTKRHVKALTVMVINRRNNTRRRFSDVTFAFQVQMEVRCASGLYPRANVTGYASSDPDAALADLHYSDVADYAVGCNTSAGWTPDDDGVVRAAYTDFLPAAEVERVEPNEKIADVEFGMEALAALAASGPDALRDGLRHLTKHYETWIAEQEKTIAGRWRPASSDSAAACQFGSAGAGSHRRGHLSPVRGSPYPAGIPGDERGSRSCRQATRGRPGWRPVGVCPALAAVPARLHPSEPVWSPGSSAPRSRSRGLALFSDRPWQDGSLSRPGRLDDRAPSHH